MTREPRIVRVGLWVWFALMVVGGADLLGLHLVSLPGSSMSSAAFSSAVGRLPFAAPGWHMVHIVYDDCRCSESVLDHLVARGVVADAETVVRIGTHPVAGVDRIRARGFTVLDLTPREAEDTLGVVGAPMLVVVQPTGAVAYAGGYTRTKQAALKADLAIYRSSRAGIAVTPLPVLGCAVNERTKKRIDPLGLR